MRVVVVGAGATGGYYGLRLALAGRDVTFLVRPARAERLRRHGLRITGHEPAALATPRVLSTEELHADAGAAPADLVLLAVKAPALREAVTDVAALVGPQTLVVPFLNGMAHLPVLDSVLGAEHVLGGVAFLATTLDHDGDVVALTPTASLTLGERSGRRPDRVAAAGRALSGAGFDVVVSDDIVGAMWAKWVFIATLSALTCLMRAPVGDVVAVPGGDRLGPALLSEAAAVAAAHGHPLAEAEQARIHSTMTQPGSTLTSSLYRDVRIGARTEVEPVLGDLLARARTASVPTPLLDLATLQLRVRERSLGAPAGGGEAHIHQ